jgi:hypothetical protein
VEGVNENCASAPDLRRTWTTVCKREMGHPECGLLGCDVKCFGRHYERFAQNCCLRHQDIDSDFSKSEVGFQILFNFQGLKASVNFISFRSKKPCDACRIVILSKLFSTINFRIR